MAATWSVSAITAEATINGNPGRKHASSNPQRSSARLAMRLAIARIEMPRIAAMAGIGAIELLAAFDSLTYRKLWSTHYP